MKNKQENNPKANIIKFFNHYHKSNIYRYSDLKKILTENKENWGLRKSINISNFIKILSNEFEMKKVAFDFPWNKETRYIKGNVSIFEIILSLKPNSYFTHHSALYLHKLIDELPQTIYVNFEQIPHYSGDGGLSQESINNAFKAPQRKSNNIASYEGQEICILNGMHTGKLGVIKIKGPLGEDLLVTNLERTLIDIVVRPCYSGGIYEILNSFKKAQGKVSITKMCSMLKRLGYKYPYHQAIGFLFEKAGYDKEEIQPLNEFKKSWDFYLDHQMKNPGYSKEWKIYYPQNFTT
jgi:hypothetical protein